MDLSELKKDLLNKTYNSSYFRKKLFPEDEWTYDRRSFDDLIRYYSPKGVTEEMLVQALFESGFRGFICEDINKVVFYKYPNKEFLVDRWPYLDLEDENIDSKYNVTYLMNLFNEIYEKELSQ